MNQFMPLTVISLGNVASLHGHCDKCPWHHAIIIKNEAETSLALYCVIFLHYDCSHVNITSQSAR